MSSTTSRVSLYKPAGGEDVNVTTDLNNNLDKIDTNLNFRVVASATARNAITPYWAGLNVRETDTGRTFVSNGTTPISASWSQIPNSGSTFDADLDLTSGKQVNVGSSGSTATFTGVLSSASADFIASRVGSDTQSRFVVDADGTFGWGPGGSTAQDTNFYRSAANTLKTDDSFEVAGNLTVGGNGIYVISDWATLSSLGTFQSGYTAGTPSPRVRKIMYLGTEVWEMKGRINFSAATTGSTIFSFTGGSSSAYAPSIEHNFGIPGGSGSSNTTVIRFYWNASGNMGASTISPAGSFSYITLNAFRIVGPLDT